MEEVLEIAILEGLDDNDIKYLIFKNFELIRIPASAHKSYKDDTICCP